MRLGRKWPKNEQFPAGKNWKNQPRKRGSEGKPSQREKPPKLRPAGMKGPSRLRDPEQPLLLAPVHNSRRTRDEPLGPQLVAVEERQLFPRKPIFQEELYN